MTNMVGATGSRSHTHTGWWLAGALLLTLAALLAWTAWQNEALRGRLAVLEQENSSLRQALAARAVAAPQPAAPASMAVVTAGPLPQTVAPAAPDPLAAYAKPPNSSPLRQGPLEEALQRLREPVPGTGVSPFGRQ